MVCRVVGCHADVRQEVAVPLRQLVNHTGNPQGWVGATMGITTHGRQHQGIATSCSRPREGRVQGAGHRRPVLVIGVPILQSESGLALQRMWRHRHPEDIDMLRRCIPWRPVLDRAAEQADAGGIDESAFVEGKANRSVDIGIHALEGLEVRSPEEDLVLRAMPISDGLASRILCAGESHDGDVPTPSCCGQMLASDVEGAPVRLTCYREGFVRGAGSLLEPILRRHLGRPVQARDRPGGMLAIHLPGAFGAEEGRPKASLQARLCGSAKYRRGEQAAGLARIAAERRTQLLRRYFSPVFLC
mmetsp:Transcript_118321/g.339547  ORF Transcript_118321/g.339547 Transcript_118321/m.339547 type:complete len:302 (+) Transcript_118321:529-1434(+)